MNMKVMKVRNIFNVPRERNPNEIEELIKKVNILHSHGEGLRITEKNDKKRNNLYWRLYSYIYNRELPMKIKSENKVIGVWSVA